MKHKIVFLTLLLLFLSCLTWAVGIDVVVMVDISESMFPVFDDVVNYLLRDLLENRLHQGDSFHLLSFADSPEKEVQITIAETSDLTDVIDRILLLKPLGQYTDLIAAVDFLYDYTWSIPERNKKLILLLTDGIHDPPPGSPNQLESGDVLARLLESSEKIKREGWDVHILRMPGETEPDGSTEKAGTTGQDLLEELSEQLETDVLTYDEVEKESLTDQLTGFSTLQFPDPLGRVRRRFEATFHITNHSAQSQGYSLIEILSNGRTLLRSSVSVAVPANQSADLVVPMRLPRGLPAGKQSLPIELAFADPEARIAPLQGDIELDYAPRINWQSLSRQIRDWQILGRQPQGRQTLGRQPPLPYLIYGLAALILIGVIIVLVFIIRHRLQDAAFARFFAGIAETRKGRRSIRPLIMKVDSQNPNIGTRNIHSVPPGARRSVGGDGSTFLIYYIQMPRRIGEIRNDGKQYRFVPKKLDYFKDLDKPLADCLGKQIRAISARGRQVIFHFQEYVSPLEEINRLMRSVPKFHIGDVPLKGATPKTE
jgi:Mg-chelatase subunit ChlD